MARRKGQTTGRCLTCKDPRRVEIERLICRGASVLSVAKKFGLSNFAIGRHMHAHVSPEARAEYLVGAGVEKLGELVTHESTSCLNDYATVRAKLYARLEAACTADDRINTCRLATVLHENFRDVARITGELQRSPLMQVQTNIINNPDNARIIAAIVSAVAPFAEARIAVAQALRRLEQPLIEASRND